VIDSKPYRGRLQLDPPGRLWHGRYPLTAVLRAVSFEADRAAQVLADPQVVVPIVAVHGAQVPWGRVVTQGVPVVSARRLPSMLCALPVVLGPERSPSWPTGPGFASTPPPNPPVGGSVNLEDIPGPVDSRRASPASARLVLPLYRAASMPGGT
jgi:hypothetical protein